MKIFKKISKKLMALLLSVSILFSNLMPITTVFALTEDEKEDLVELRMRRATGIDINNGEATIHYEDGEVIVAGNDLYHVEDNHWDYGDGNYGVMHILYTSSTNLTFHFYPDEGMQASINFNGNPTESPNNNEWTVNNLLLRNQRAEGYDLEFQFAPEINGSGGGVSMPNGSSYQVEFGNASWNLDNVNVTASIQGKDLTDGFLSVVDNEVIELTNFNPGTMEVRVSTRDGFSTELFVDENNTTCLGWTINSVLPSEDLYFNVQPRAVHNDGTYHVQFGPADWNIDDEVVGYVFSVYGEGDGYFGQGYFTITFVENKDLLPSLSRYIIDDASDIIRNIRKQTTVTEFKNSITVAEGGVIKVFDKTGTTEVTGQIGTGMQSRVIDEYNRNVINIGIAVQGDTTGDGNISLTDLVKVKFHLLETEILEDVYEAAANVDGTSGITITDLVQMSKDVMGIKELD